MSNCVVNTPEEFATAVFDGMNGFPPIAAMPNRKELLLKFFDGIFSQAYTKETELRQTIKNLKAENKGVRNESRKRHNQINSLEAEMVTYQRQVKRLEEKAKILNRRCVVMAAFLEKQMPPYGENILSFNDDVEDVLNEMISDLKSYRSEITCSICNKPFSENIQVTLTDNHDLCHLTCLTKLSQEK